MYTKVNDRLIMTDGVSLKWKSNEVFMNNKIFDIYFLIVYNGKRIVN